jgi:galactonate dehydratase
MTKSAITAALSLTAFSDFGKGLEQAVDRAPLLSNPSDLKITEIKCGYIRNGHSLFVKVHTNQGIWGCGEGVDATPGYLSFG